MTTPQLCAYRVLSVNERACRVWADGEAVEVRFSATFPRPRMERVAPGHLVAVTSGRDVPEVVVWRWFDAVVVGPLVDGGVALWEPAHGEVAGRARDFAVPQEPGCRAYVSAGLPGADWWIACAVEDGPDGVSFDLEQVIALYDENDLWAAAFDLPD